MKENIAHKKIYTPLHNGKVSNNDQWLANHSKQYMELPTKF